MKVELYQGLLEINWNLLFSAITVLVLYLILKHFFFEKVHKFMVARQEAVQKELDDAKQTKDDADAMLANYKETLSGAEEEKAVVQLKKEIASLAVQAAGQIMEKEMDDSSQEDLVNKVLEEAASGKWQNQ